MPSHERPDVTASSPTSILEAALRAVKLDRRATVPFSAALTERVVCASLQVGAYDLDQVVHHFRGWFALGDVVPDMVLQHFGH